MIRDTYIPPENTSMTSANETNIEAQTSLSVSGLYKEPVPEVRLGWMCFDKEAYITVAESFHSQSWA